MRLDFDIPEGYNEEWKTVPSYPLYQVSSVGRVRRAKNQKVISQYVSKAGYAVATLSIEARVFVRLVHVLVAEAFIGPKPLNHFVTHVDGDKLNNAPKNLIYKTGASYSGAPAPSAALSVPEVPAGANYILVDNYQVIKSAIEPDELVNELEAMARADNALSAVNGTKTSWGKISGIKHGFAPMSYVVCNSDDYIVKVVSLLYVGTGSKPETVEAQFEDLEEVE